MDEWWLQDREPGEEPYKEHWSKEPRNIFISLIVGVVVILWWTLRDAFN